MESANKINTMAASAVSEDEFKKVANKVSFITIVQNVLLSVFKLFAGIFAHSNAMISDAVHSASDVFSTIIVIIGVKLASKESDKEHPYGHERLECVTRSAAGLSRAASSRRGIPAGCSAGHSTVSPSSGISPRASSWAGSTACSATRPATTSKSPCGIAPARRSAWSV